MSLNSLKFCVGLFSMGATRNGRSIGVVRTSSESIVVCIN